MKAKEFTINDDCLISGVAIFADKKQKVHDKRWFLFGLNLFPNGPKVFDKGDILVVPDQLIISES